MGYEEQFLLTDPHGDPRRVVWADERVFPAYVACASAALLVLRGIYTSGPFKRLVARCAPVSSTEEVELVPATREWKQRVQARVASHGGAVIFTAKVLRVVAVLALLALTVATALRSNQHDIVSWALVATLSYASIIGLYIISASGRHSRIVGPHLTFVLLGVFAMYAYRNIWPLMTFTLHPADGAEGHTLWAKIALAAFAGVIEPVIEPYPYVPVDPFDPMPMPNPEQTASIASFITFSFLDPTIFLAYRMPHLSHDQLPPLCDYDRANNLIKRSYPWLDPFAGAKKRNLFWGICIIFRRSLFLQAIIIVSMSFLKLASPIGTNRLLNYLETGGAGAVVKPWVWIIALAFGPMVNTALFQTYIFLSTGTLVRVESILTSLVFDHALRIRLKAEVQETKSSTSGTTTPDTASISPSSGDEDAEDGDTVHSRSATAASTATTSTLVGAPEQGKGKGKGKGKDTKAPEPAKDAKPADKDPKAKGSNLVGKINNLITSDLENITDGRDFLFLVLSAPLQILSGMIFLYSMLGWSTFVGMAVMIAMFPVPAWSASLMQGVQKDKMKATDSRVETVTEMMNVLRMIKLFGWEGRVGKDISEKRENELWYIWKRKMLNLINNIMNHTIPLVHMVVTYITFTVFMKQQLTAAIVFSSMAGFDMLRMQMFRIFQMVPGMIQANVSLGRVADFLRNTELLDSFVTPDPTTAIVDSSAAHASEIGFGRAQFSWSNEVVDGSLTPSRQGFRLRIEDQVVFKQGAFNLIVGATGSGKSSILMALLGEMHYIPSGPDSWVNLPRDGGIAYAAQESWVQNETIKENILFGSPYDAERYKKVIYQCGLKRDLSLFEAGDATEVGEKGLTLSGGQKARITLARAVYSPAKIILMDDVLAALDVHTSRWIVDKCFKGDLIRGRTVLLVTHNVAMASPIADYVVSMGTDGRILSQGSVSDVITLDKALDREIAHEEQAIDLAEMEDDADDVVTPESKKGKLVVAEEIAEGHVSWAALKLFIGALGGRWPILFWACFFGGSGISEAAASLETWWLGWWARQYSLHHRSEVSVPFYLGIYCAIVGFVILTYIYGTVLYTYASMRASRTIHKKLVGSLLGSTFRWLDTTPTSRVIARCTQDIQAIDGPVAQNLNYVLEITISMVMKMLAVMIFTPLFALPGVFIAIVGGWTGQIYMKAQLSVKREMSNAKAPVLGIFGGAIAGLTSIRAYNAQDSFKKETTVRIDRYVRSARTFYNLNRWVTVRIDALSAGFAAALATYLIYGNTKINPSNVGFSLNMAVGFSEMILWWVRLLNELEVSGNSLERIQAYLTIEQEPKPKEGGAPPAYWPASGDIRVENLTARYSPDGPKVLENVSFHIRSGERVGIVGRTGSGKSSLTLSLLRCIYTDGAVYYDGIPTHSLNLDALRSKVTIIPQVPELLSGTLRQNLDMFEEHDDATLNDALRAAGLFSLQSDADENKITLDSAISSGGSNLSVGQRQILALARAIVRQSKLLILDEATSAIDYETDAIIQSSLRKELKNDVTVVTVAHRLQTIMDSDKIMVLDAGRLVEFGTPKELLNTEKSFLRALVDESADKETLIAMAEGKVQPSI